MAVFGFQLKGGCSLFLAYNVVCVIGGWSHPTAGADIKRAS